MQPKSPKAYQPVTPSANPWMQLKYDIQNYNDHRKNVLNAQPKVDDSAPYLCVPFYVRIQKLAVNANRLQVVAKENKQMVQRINKINRTMGKVDCHMPPYHQGRNLEERQKEATLIQRHNIEFFKRLLKVEPEVPKTKDLLLDWKRFEKALEHSSLYPLFWKEREQKELEERKQWSVMNSSAPLVDKKSSLYKATRPRVFFDITASDRGKLGQLVIELYGDIVPDTANNFLSLCRGDNDFGLCYKNTPLSRVITGLYCQGGDVIYKNGTGGKSIYGDTFPDENFTLKHSGRGVVTMHNFGPGSNNSQFFITFRKLESLNGKNVAFGRVIKGFHTLALIEDIGTRTGKPLVTVAITNCGQVDY